MATGPRTLTTCTHEWRNDDPFHDAEGFNTHDRLTLDEAIARFEQRARRGEDVTEILAGLYTIERRTR